MASDQRNRPGVLNVLIASPSDVQQERDAVTVAIYAWNASHTASLRVLLNPVRWETHSFPQSGQRPQRLINRQIVETGDILIGIFGNRLGTPTGTAASGTLEEIEHFRATGKYVGLYFSTADVPRGVDRTQLDAVEAYRKEREADTLYASFVSPDDLREQVSQHLPHMVATVAANLNLGIWSTAVPVQAAHHQETPLTLQTQITSSPSGAVLTIDANRPIKVFQLDYLDRNDIRISTNSTALEGVQLRVPLPHAELVKIWNLSPGGGVVPISFRLHVDDAGFRKTEIVRAGLNMTSSMSGSTTTMYFDVLH